MHNYKTFNCMFDLDQDYKVTTLIEIFKFETFDGATNCQLWFISFCHEFRYIY